MLSVGRFLLVFVQNTNAITKSKAYLIGEDNEGNMARINVNHNTIC